MKRTTMMPTTRTTIMKEHYGYVAVLSLLLGSLTSSEAFLVSPSRAVFSVNHPRQANTAVVVTEVTLQGVNVPYFASGTETSAKTKSEAASVVVAQQHQGGSNNNKNDSDDDDDAADEDDDGGDPYAKLGINEEALAISINPEEVLKYIGTREDLIQKTLTDIPKMQREQAEIEVDKFLLDAEALQIFIEFKKRKEVDPDFSVPGEIQEDEGFFSIRTAVYIYLAYVAYTSGPIAIREYVKSQVEAGSWKGTGIPQLDEWLLEVPPAAIVASLTDTAASVSDTASVISADTLLQAAQVVGDSLN